MLARANATDAERYDDLLHHACRVAALITASRRRPRVAAAAHVWAHAQALLAFYETPPPGAVVSEPTGAIEALDRLAENWAEICSGRITGAGMMQRYPGLWHRLMTEWPMGSYAAAITETLHEHDALDGRVLEIGCGVGNTTAKVAGLVSGEFVWTDKLPGLVRAGRWAGSGQVYDFDEQPPASLGRFDTIFATNALHCAADKLRTLRRLRSILHDGGAILLAEGSNVTTAAGTPWALNFFFCAFNGWWDRGGFLVPDEWIDLLRTAGFSEVARVPIHAGSHDLGGIVHARVRNG